MKRVSVVISVLNGASCIEHCLRSIIDSDYTMIEIIVIDGGSTDGTLDIIDKYMHQIYYFISEVDRGIYDAWNKAISVSRGDWITFIGSDDQWRKPESLTSLMKIASYPNVNYVSGKAHLADNKKQSIGQKFDYSSLMQGMKFMHVGSLHHKSLFKNYGGFDANYRIAGDYDFFVRNGKYIRSAFHPDEIILMGSFGISSMRYHKALLESFNSLKSSADFGLIKAIIFILISYAALGRRKLMRDLFANG